MGHEKIAHGEGRQEMIAIVDYGLGNVRAFVNIYERMKVAAALVTSEDGLAGADKIILPGVGAFDWAMERLAASGMIDCLNELVLGQGRPVLGVCVGMQIMAKRSDEGERPGLGWIDEEVKRFEDPDRNGNRGHAPSAHGVERCGSTGLGQRCFGALSSRDTTSCTPTVSCRGTMTWYWGSTDYYGMFASAVRSDNIFGVQFHPEKSHSWGVKLLQNFAAI